VRICIQSLEKQEQKKNFLFKNVKKKSTSLCRFFFVYSSLIWKMDKLVVLFTAGIVKKSSIELHTKIWALVSFGLGAVLIARVP
jgi:hypothetical protein